MSKKKWLSALTAAAMVLALLPSTVFAAGGEENGNLVIGGKTYEPVSADRLTTSVVKGVEAKIENGFVDYTVSDSADKSDWDQNSGVGSVQTYTYVGLYVNIPDGATTLKRDDEGNPDDVTVVDGAFLQDGKYQKWFPIADKTGEEYSLFYGGREYTVLLEWYDNGGQLIKSEYVKATHTLKDPEAKIGDYTYATLSDAIAAAGDNDVVELCKNVTLTETLNINQSVTIDGKDFIISGDNNKAYTAFNITAGNFTIKNATVKEFGGNVYTRQGVAVFSVPATADAKVVFNASNVKVSEYNRSAFDIASGTFNIDSCETDAMNSYVKSGKNSLTKGITTGYGSNKVTGTISNCILNGAADHPDWSAAAVEVYYNADVKLIGSEINTFTTGVWVDNYYSPEGTSSSLDIQDTTIVVPEGNDAVVVYGEYNGQGGLGSSDVNILSGVFEGNIAIYGKTANDVVMISGGTFKGQISEEADFAEGVVMDENGNARIDNSALKALVDSYEALKLNKADYTEASWKAYEAALAQAKAVLANVNATKSDIDTAKANLEAAYKGLTKPEAQPEKEVPKTADNNLVLWVALLLVGCGSVLGGVAYRKQSDKAWRRFR